MYNEENLLKALAAFAKGQMVVVTDDNNRENEGDLVVAASHCTSENMAFMIRYTSGIICAPITKAVARRLDLPPMVERNSSAYNTAFTVSVDSKYDTTTGISAFERTATVKRLAESTSLPRDFIRPGHVFPLIAREGGVLARSGHTEAAVDLCVLAGLPPIAVIGELMNDDGTVQHGDEIVSFAAKHSLPMLSVEDLIIYRQRHEVLAQQTAKFELDSFSEKAIAYHYNIVESDKHYMVLVTGDAKLGKAALFIDELNFFKPGSVKFSKTVKEIEEKYIKHQCSVCIRILTTTRASKDVKESAEEYSESLARREHWAIYGASAQILRDLGIKTVYLPDITLPDEVAKYKEELNACGIFVEGE